MDLDRLLSVDRYSLDLANEQLLRDGDVVPTGAIACTWYRRETRRTYTKPGLASTAKFVAAAKLTVSHLAARTTELDVVVKTNAADMQTKGNPAVISFLISPVLLTVLTWFCFALNVAYTPTVRSRALTDDGTGVRLW